MIINNIDVGFVSATDTLVGFYQGVFDLEILEPRVFPMGTVHRLAFGPTTLKIMVPTVTPGAPDLPGQFWEQVGLRYVTVWVEDLGAVLDRWVAAGGTVTTPPTVIRPGVSTSLLADPDGNTVEAMQQSA